MLGFAFETGFENRLLKQIAEKFQTVGPVMGGDGVCRLQPVSQWEELSRNRLSLIPAKKFLLPPIDLLWSRVDHLCLSPDPPSAVALVGLFPCDLYALDYLDQVFDEDPLYRRRRQRLLLVGTDCSPGPQCFCPPRRAPPQFDLFLIAGQVWPGSERGSGLLAALADGLEEDSGDLPGEVSRGQSQAFSPKNLEPFWVDSENLPLWKEVGERCVSCGACSAVCPTCYCYDVVDEAFPGGAVTRLREWDNCFFRSHALVAGGHHFCPTRSERLRFRFEHKLLGFGPLRGVSSCVGCGRCGQACPVAIDISEVLARLTGGG